MLHVRAVRRGRCAHRVPLPVAAPAERKRLRQAHGLTQGASDQQLQRIAAEALKEMYFQDNGRRAGQLEEVRFTDIEHLEFDL